MNLKAYVILIAGVFAAPPIIAAAEAAALPQDIDWESIKPSQKLVYQPCLEKFHCARLELPMDRKNPSDNKTVAVAVIRLAAAMPANDSSTFAGPIVLNPGGPGGSGVEFLPAAAELIQGMVDIPGKRHYEIVSFDPRGIGASTPAVDCFPTAPLARKAWILEALASGTPDQSDQSLIYALGAAKNEFQRCHAAGNDILPFVNTPSVAQDMVALVDRMDEFHRKQYGNNAALSTHRSDAPRLQYIGISYGTILGNYFASMFPGRVGRVVLDGVWDANDYAKGPGALSNTVDADEMMDIFFQGCFDVGAQVCKLRQPTDASPRDISTRTWAWINALDEQPITGVASGGASYTIRSGEIRATLFQSLYSAGFSFPGTASALSEAITGGDSTAIANIVTSVYALPTLNDGSTAPSRPTLMEGRDAVLCGDAEDVTDKGLAYWRDYLKKQMSISKLAAGAWTGVRVPCSAWRVKANWTFRGPFTSPEPSRNSSSPQPGHPAAPLLMTTNRYDPATPLRDARSVAASHPGAGVLIQESMGHALIGSLLVSNCSKHVISDYFNRGVVPNGETVCERARDPWQPVDPGEPTPQLHVRAFGGHKALWNALTVR